MSSRASASVCSAKTARARRRSLKILTGEMDYNSGEIAFAQGKRSASFADPGLSGRVHGERCAAHGVFKLDKIKARMRQLEKSMTEHTPKEVLSGMTRSQAGLKRAAGMKLTPRRIRSATAS